ncbi:RagB/SusD family nutrient uptake outer membrane protein [Olivibacter sp. XZL3]|uniref:RagB/SusD family nutrient uptake outer membrane protein n=1 Tax=Olivibacter sp. XZL3 TaxID=1735116 RepID=UPI0010648439|nr:RagB/SusD family nutrient uptake outer membrane protein [Olivibacter sp. XZL3]
MKKINYSHYVVLLLSCLLATACQEQLNVYPTTTEVDGQVIVDTKSANTVLNGVYYRFANAGVDNNSVPNILWTSIHEVLPSQLSGLQTSVTYDEVYAHALTASSSVVSRMWTYGYNLVNAANGFLKNIEPVDAIPAATKMQMQAEAKFLRAFGNNILLQYFGQYDDVASPHGIILRKDFVTPDQISLPRSSVADVYTAILADLDEAIANLPALNTQIYYANISAAKLLKARVLINRASEGDYQEVIRLTDEVITNGPFELEANTKDIFLSKGFASKEVILGVQPYGNQTYKFQSNQYSGTFPATDTLVSLLKDDPRETWVYKDDQRATVYGRNYGNLNEITKYYSGNVVDAVQTPLADYCYAFRLTEAYLLEAEALTMAPSADLNKAKALLKTVMGHAGISDFSAVEQTNSATDLKTLIVKEEMKNFVSENGADWFALRRLPLATVQSIQPNIKSKRNFILPIPQDEINRNNKISQIP